MRHGLHSIHTAYADKWRDMNSLCMHVDNHDATRELMSWIAGEIVGANLRRVGVTSDGVVLPTRPSFEVLTAGLAEHRSASPNR
jgi:hypothetical protein